MCLRTSQWSFLVHQCSDIKCALVDGYLQTKVRLGTTETLVRFSVHMNLPEIRVIVFRKYASKCSFMSWTEYTMTCLYGKIPVLSVTVCVCNCIDKTKYSQGGR